MNYIERIEIVENTIQEFCRIYIIKNYNILDKLYLKIDIQTAYKDTFATHFQEYFTKDVEKSIWTASEHIVYSLTAFLRTNPESSLEQILKFTEIMISIQIAHFESWCKEIIEA